MGWKPTDEWRTPKWLFQWANQTFGPFQIDVAASNGNHLCEEWFTRENSALDRPWTGKCWMNPPYSHGNLWEFCQKAFMETDRGNADLVFGLLKDDRSTKWYWNFVKPCTIEIVPPKRIAFEGADAGAKFPVVFVIWYNKRPLWQ